MIALQLFLESYTEFPSSTIIEDNPSQSLNDDCSIEVTLLGIIMDFKPLHPAKASSPIFFVSFGIIVFLQPTINLFVFFSIIALQSFRESNVVLLLSTLIEAKLIHP